MERKVDQARGWGALELSMGGWVRQRGQRGQRP